MNSNGTSLDYRLTPNSDSDCGLDGSTLTFGDWGSLSADCYVEAFQSVEHADYHTPSPVVAWIMVDYVFISISIDNPDRQARFGTEETVTAREPSGNIQSAYFSVTGDSCHFGNGQKFTELAANAAKTYTFSVTLFIDPPPPGTTADTCTVRIEANPDDKWASGSDDQATATFTITGG